MSRSNYKKEKFICPLCDQSKKIIKSHIIPESFYKKLYEGRNNTAIFTSKKRHRYKPIQIGIYNHILCKECDGEKINYYDSFASDFFIKEIPKYIPPYPLSLIITKDKIFYTRLKGFIYSVFWRAHYSKADIHKEFNINSINLDLIKECLLNKDFNNKELPKLTISITCFYPNDHDIMRGIISSFNIFRYPNEVGGGRFAAVLFGGFLFEMMLDNNYPKELERDFISDDNKFEITQIYNHQLPMYSLIKNSTDFYNSNK